MPPRPTKMRRRRLARAGDRRGARMRFEAVGAARSALHLRQLRRRQAQRVRLCRRPARRRAPPSRAVQPAVPLWRRRPRQDPPDARHRLARSASAIRDRRVLYLSAEKFMYRFIRALRTKDTMAFKELFRSVDVLMVDDVQFISGKDSDPGGVLPHLQRAGRPEPADRASPPTSRPSDLRGHRGAACARGSAGAWSPTSTRPPTSCGSASCRPRPSSCGVAVPPKVLEFLAHQITSNVRELEGRAEPRRRPRQPDRPRDHARDGAGGAARPAARQRPPGHDRGDPEARWPSTTTSAGRHDLGRGARAAVARPRQVAMYLAKQLTPRSLPEIGTQVRRPRPHHGDARRAQDRGAARLRCLASPRTSSCCSGCCEG